MYTIDDIGAVFTSCLYPEFTIRAVQSVLSHYPGIQGVIVDDCERGPELKEAARANGFEIITNETRVGTGRSIDRGLRLLSRPLLLTVDHGVELKKGGILEYYLEKLKGDAIGIGPKRNDKRCNKAFGPYIDPVFSLWDREFVVEHPDLSFKLTHIRIGTWQVDGCSTAQFLQYRAMKLGKVLSFADPYDFILHHRTPRDRGNCASPHELIEISEDYITPRRKDKDGNLIYQGS